jgi:hypothetical protein
VSKKWNKERKAKEDGGKEGAGEKEDAGLGQEKQKPEKLLEYHCAYNKKYQKIQQNRMKAQKGEGGTKKGGTRTMNDGGRRGSQEVGEGEGGRRDKNDGGKKKGRERRERKITFSK